MYPIAIKAILGDSLLKVQSWGWAILCWVQNMKGRSCYALMRNESINPQMWRYPFLWSYRYGILSSEQGSVCQAWSLAPFLRVHIEKPLIFLGIKKQDILYFYFSSSSVSGQILLIWDAQSGMACVVQTKTCLSGHTLAVHRLSTNLLSFTQYQVTGKVPLLQKVLYIAVKMDLLT